MREDILGGLKNAIDRGSAIEQAVQTFINAGYPVQEVNEAAQYLKSSLTLHAFSPPISSQPQRKLIPIDPKLKSLSGSPIKSTQQPLQSKNYQNQQQTQKLPYSFEVKRNKSSFNITIIMLLIVLLISISAFITTLVYKEQIANYIADLLS